MSALSSDWWKRQKQTKIDESCFQQHKKKSFVLKNYGWKNRILLTFLQNEAGTNMFTGEG